MKKKFYMNLHDRLKENNEVYLMTIIDGTVDGRNIIGQKMFKTKEEVVVEDSSIMFIWEELLKKVRLNKSTFIFNDSNGIEVFVEYLVGQPTLLICGGGHIALPLCNIGKLLDFNVVVIDDRKEFADSKRFYMADRVICGDFAEILKNNEFNKNTYAAIITRGHSADSICLESIINKGYAYVGMIGSRAKVHTVMKKLREKGFSEELLESVHTPIGLDIGGQTPSEIAVSIAAEIIKEKNKSIKSDLGEDILDFIINNNDRSVLATIIEKIGSSPRGVGSKMIVSSNKSVIGTIGGGSVEHAAYERSLDIISANESAVEVYDLSNTKAAKLGMACGGKIKVVFEII